MSARGAWWRIEVMGRTLITVGLILVALGLLVSLTGRLPSLVMWIFSK
ncbi:hypothetical protein SBA3_1790001 [Candidatus Sulfopaludibacter sp. SbA3]|nr:hypothetical protein SBA3_1790001 [Candidatus Sulfopaludibacter sp. SbA3]